MMKAMKMRGVLTITLLVLAVVAVGGFGACSYKSRMRNSAFEAVRLGDTEAAVIASFGAEPSVREKPRALFSRYASQPCGGECAERLWFENRISFDTEAWSVELDKNRRVIKKTRWVSP